MLDPSFQLSKDTPLVDVIHVVLVADIDFVSLYAIPPHSCGKISAAAEDLNKEMLIFVNAWLTPVRATKVDTFIRRRRQ